MIRRSVLIHSIPRIHSLAIRSQYAVITEADLVKVTQEINGDDNLRVQEFTSVLDRRELPETVGIILEITGNIGMASCLRLATLRMMLTWLA